MKEEREERGKRKRKEGRALRLEEKEIEEKETEESASQSCKIDGIRKENKEIESYLDLLPFVNGSSLLLSSHVHLFALINPCWSPFPSVVNRGWIRVLFFSGFTADHCSKGCC